jgi:hypothetical protein
MIVLVAGMPRSGSTFSFNVAREILRTRGTVYQEASEDVVGAACRSDGVDHLLIKAHKLDAPSLALARSGGMRIIMTVRRAEDAVASLINTFDTVPETIALQVMRDWLELYQQLRPHALVVPFEQVDRRPWLATLRIARLLNLRIAPTVGLAITRRFSKAEVKRRTETMSCRDAGVIDLGFSQYDQETFFHRRHVSRLQSPTAEELLPKERLAMIRDFLAPFMRAAGL